MQHMPRKRISAPSHVCPLIGPEVGERIGWMPVDVPESGSVQVEGQVPYWVPVEAVEPELPQVDYLRQKS